MSSSSPNSSSPPLSTFNLQYENNLNIITSLNTSPNIPTTKAFVCEICNKAFRFRSNLAEHRSVHTAVKPFVCKFCGKSSRLKGNLTKHILKHHKNEQRDYIGTDDYIIKKGKKSVKDPAAIEFLERSMIVLNNSSSANNAKQRNSKESDSKESSVNLDNNDNNNEINTDNIFNSLGFNNSFEMKEEENNDCEQQASSPLTPENENNKGEEQNVMSVVALMAAAAASSSCPAFLENNTNEEQNEDMEEDEEEEEIEPLTNNPDISTPQNNFKQNYNNFNNIQNVHQNNKDNAPINNNAASAACKALFQQLFGGGNEASNSQPNEQLLRFLSQINEMTHLSDSNTQQQQNKIKIEETIVPNIKTNSFLSTKCKQCGKSFRKPRDLLSHLATAHKLVNGQDNNNNNNNMFPNKQAQTDTPSQQSSPCNSVFSASTDLKSSNNLPEILAIELKRLRKTFFNSKNNEENGGQLNLNNSGSLVRVEQILGQLDSRVCRLEKQVEMALNSIYTLVQLQTGINNNMNKLNRSLTNFQNNGQNNNNTQ
uniref:C2H2-type domain-containing protein n=2 Tax=Meloidogyne enterolobii TaxID=390850 RepID=A0A6V7WY74_MELEN|nr:unnamed protein product [Meloidogyne enterolobii]